MSKTYPFQTIIFNGPPNSGKDEAAAYVEKTLGAHRMQFKQHLFELAFVMFNVSPGEFFELYDNRETKEVPTCLLNGFSPRNALIYVSETVMKPNFGMDYFGRIAAEQMEYGVNVFSDGGFVEEIDPVYTQSDGRLLIVRLHRPGCDYSLDSRNYIYNNKYISVDLHNDSSLEIFHLRIADVVGRFLDGEING